MKHRNYGTIRVSTLVPKAILPQKPRTSRATDYGDHWYITMYFGTRKGASDAIRTLRRERRREKNKPFRIRGYRWTRPYLKPHVSGWSNGLAELIGDPLIY